MSDIISIDELYGKKEINGLSSCLKQVINTCLVEGIENKISKVAITSKDESIMKELFEKRKEVISSLHDAGYVSVITSDIDTEESTKNTGWRLSERGLEPIPSKLKTQGNNLHWRGDVTYANYRLWVMLPDTLEE